ncbi:hypothetical protein CAEBREN_12031 [Caenorhabditis brenneri]|uniref:HTH CENPB-type domain-containing protein n=1 Tax=Caenorhabditis brenneri TaxID=135651 RepID=G0PHR5_CAEBE|nr:hypothetical protein CAEBREN_12031 [Caenorhabditis brenneri]
MAFNKLNVLSLLISKFESCGPIPRNPTVTREERKIADRVAGLIEEADDGYMDIDDDEVLIIEEDADYEVPEFDVLDSSDVPHNLTIRFGDKWVSKEEVDKAIKYYREPAKGSRTPKTMSTRFRWLTLPSHLQKLREIEEAGPNYRGDRCRLLQILSDRLFEEVKKRFDMGITLHDNSLHTLAIEINRNETMIQNFLASSNWISRWKKSHRIVSRKITRFVTRKCLINKGQIENTAKKFVEVCRREMSLFSPSMIFNGDQTGVQKELHGARALAIMGEQDIERIAQAKSSLTHSFTFLPMLFADGTMGPKAYMVIGETTGAFPPSRPIPDPPNLVVRPGKSHIMTKLMMCDWLKSCVFLPNGPTKLFMLVDSWPSFKDHQTIRSCVPPGVDLTIRNIPPHCTSLIQPLDKYWNGPWKNLLKKFTNYALTFQPEYIVAQRNNQIWMVALLYHQVSAVRFKEFLKYSWKKSGYTDHSCPFLTPSQYCYDVAFHDCYETNCTRLAFIHCARCEEFVCFHHFIVAKQHMCLSP